MTQTFLVGGMLHPSPISGSHCSAYAENSLSGFASLVYTIESPVGSVSSLILYM